MASIKQIQVDSTTYDIDAVTLGGQLPSYYASAVALEDYIPLSGTTSIYGNLVPTSNASVDLGASDKEFRSVYGKKIVTTNIYNSSYITITAGSYDTANPGGGITYDAQNHWITLYNSVASAYFGLGVYSGNTLFSAMANKNFGIENITIGHGGTSSGFGITLQTHNSTSIYMNTSVMRFKAKDAVEMIGYEYGGYIGLNNGGVHLWANYSNYDAGQLWLGSYTTVLTGGYTYGVIPNLTMTSDYIGIGWHTSRPSEYMHIAMSSYDCSIYNPSYNTQFGIAFNSIGYGFVTNYLFSSSAGYMSILRAARMGYMSYNTSAGYWEIINAPIQAGYCHHILMYQANKCALRFDFYDLNTLPVNSSTNQNAGMQSTSAYCKGALSRLAKYLYWNGYRTSSKTVQATGFYSGAGSKIALGIYADGTASTNLYVVYISSFTVYPYAGNLSFLSSTTANIYIYDTVGNPAHAEGLVYTYQS